jgi:hypothetical protein
VILNPGAILLLGTAGSAANVDERIPNTSDVMFDTGSTPQFDTGTGGVAVNAGGTLRTSRGPTSSSSSTAASTGRSGRG